MEKLNKKLVCLQLLYFLQEPLDFEKKYHIDIIKNKLFNFSSKNSYKYLKFNSFLFKNDIECFDYYLLKFNDIYISFSIFVDKDSIKNLEYIIDNFSKYYKYFRQDFRELFNTLIILKLPKEETLKLIDKLLDFRYLYYKEKGIKPNKEDLWLQNDDNLYEELIKRRFTGYFSQYSILNYNNVVYNVFVENNVEICEKILKYRLIKLETLGNFTFSKDSSRNKINWYDELMNKMKIYEMIIKDNSKRYLIKEFGFNEIIEEIILDYFVVC